MRADIAPDLIADVTLYPTAKGGRKGPTPSDWLGCPCKVGDAYWDCRILFHGKPMSPGDKRRVGLVFLSKAVAAAEVRAAGRFLLWEGGIIGEGTVVPG